MEVETECKQESSHYLTLEERWRIVGFWQCCENQTRTAEFFEVTQSAVSKILDKWRSGLGLSDIKRSGRPSVDRNDLNDQITEYVEENRYISSQQIAQNLDISKVTTLKVMKEFDMKYALPKQIPILNASHIEKRYTYTKSYQGIDVKDLIFTDESYFNIQRSKQKCWHFNNQTQYTPQSQEQICLMVWAAISWEGKSQICIKPSGYKINSESYIQILKDYLSPFIQELNFKEQNKDRQMPYLLVQDNAPCHRSLMTKEFISKLDVILIKHPPSSPDLNAIEQVWAILKARVEKQRPSNQEEFEFQIKKEWNLLPQHNIQNCILHYEKRLEEVYSIKGAFY
ncbi:hypothetical protein ABPG72_018588 [Tetrahymena utriculariae]